MPPRPLLIVFKGHPGVGKSTVARALGRTLGIAIIDKDDVKDVLAGACTNAGGLAYEVMFRVARRQLLQGLHAICDSPLSEELGYQNACAAAASAEAALVVIECICSDPVEWRSRIEQRAAQGLPTHQIDSWAALERHLERRSTSSRYPINHPYLLLDTIQPLEQEVARAIAWMREEARVFEQ
ncbi:MAG TPA: AAA family ATPase [Roseiflexaceae bacterium]|nr:AAA family ATPase [Roseiflexaceae bacterium]